MLAREWKGAEGLPDRLNLGCGLDVRPGYVNADAYVEREDVLPLDVTERPYPFPDGWFREVLLSHVLEHVPPVFRRDERGRLRDVLMDVMEEVHRVLAPRGLAHVRVPLGGSGLDFCHWQHYRHVTPGWFKYLNQANFEARPYALNFEVADGPHYNVWSAHGDQGPRVRGTPLTVHLAQRVPGLRPLLARDVELVFTLRKLPLPKRPEGP